MSYQDLVRDFNKDYNVNLDVHPIIKRITTIFNTYEGDRIREEDIKNYILESYSALAKDFQINKSKAALAASQNTSNLNAGNFLDRYIDIVTEIASFVSDDLEELAKKEAKQEKNEKKK